jgi:hypothetical protein
MKHRVHVAIAPIRKEPSDRSEMVSQGLMGEELSILERQEKWTMVRMWIDGYEGWIDNKQFEESNDVEQLTELTAPITRCVSTDGSSLWLPAAAGIPASWKIESTQIQLETGLNGVALSANQFLNAPYLWGGRTILGIDCSGLTQLVFRLNGISIPRDAYQQAEMGATISFIEEAHTGDLAFFDNAEGRIVHVGIVLRSEDGQVQIIHASGKVRVDALDHQGVFNRETRSYTHKLRIIKRME